MKMQRLLGAICAGLLLLSLPAKAAEQNSYVTPSAGPMSMATFTATYLNPALRAIAACHNGSSAPANGPGSAPLAYQCWVDTTANPSVYKIYDGASWVSLGSINTTTHVWSVFGSLAAATGLPISSGLSGAGAGILAALAVNVGTAGSPVINGGVLGTPSSGVATNLTGTAAGLTAGNVTTNANLTGDVTSVGNTTTLTNAPVIAKVLTGFTSGAGTVSAADSILSALQKINGNVALKAPTASPTFTGTVTIPSGAALGTPTTLVGTNITGTAAGLTAGNVTTNANLTGHVTSVGNATTLTNAPVIAKVLTGFTSGAGTVSAADSILSALQKIDGNVALKAPTASPNFTGIVNNQGTLKLSAFVTSTQITANQNDYTGTDGSNTCSSKLTLRISSDASRNITGLSCSQAEGDIRVLHNVGAQNIVLTNQDAGSTAGNRFLFGGGDMTLAADTSVTIRYDGVASRWRAITTPGAGGGGGGVTSVTIAGAGLNSTSGTCTITGTGTCTVTAAYPPKFWQGYTHSNNVGTPNTKIDVAAGSCRDSTDAINIVNSAGTIDLGTTGANGLDAGSLANTTFYYTFAITTAGGSTAYLASTSPTAPTLPGSYTKFRRIGGFKTNGSAQVLPFTHVNNQWWYSTAIRDVNTAVQGTTFISYVLSVPKVQGVVAQYSITYFASAAITINVLPGFLPTTASAGQAYYSPSSSGSTEISQTQVDSSGQIQVKSTSASSTIVVDTAGWVDDL
jgi:hypothetical protein